MLQGKKPLLLALLLAFAAAVLGYTGVKKAEHDVREGWDTVKVICADQDIKEGTELEEGMVSIRDIPRRFVTESYYRLPEEEGAREKFQAQLPYGQRVMVPLKRGDPILVSHIETAKLEEFSKMIQKRGRAIALDVSEKASVGGWVQPNDHVDVIGTIRDDATHEFKTLTLAQDVIVLATGKRTANTVYVPEEEKRYTTVSVMVLPEEAEILTLAQESGTLSLALRNPEDLDRQENRSFAEVKTLFTGERIDALFKKRVAGIQIIKGGKGADQTAP